MRIAIATLFILVVTGSAQPTWYRFRSPAPIKRVSIRDADFKVVKVLAPAEVAAFRQHWQNKQEVKVSLSKMGGQHFKLDIERKGSGARFLYMTTGYVQVLSKQVKPVYKLQDPEAFNRLIGATK